jgi:hypothetical protein
MIERDKVHISIITGFWLDLIGREELLGWQIVTGQNKTLIGISYF